MRRAHGRLSCPPMEENRTPAAFATPSAPYCAEESFTVTAQGQDLEFHPGGSERLAALLALIDGAQESLRLCFYIFATDTAGRTVRDALVAAARRKVDVQVIVDGFGARASHDFFAPLVEAGGQFFEFSPRWGQRYLIRNHQKIVLADGARAMIGGFNIEDDYFAPSDGTGWSDLGVVLSGSAVEQLALWYDELERWVSNPKANWLTIRRMVREWQPGNGPVRLLIGGPTRVLSSWARCLARDLIAGERLDLIMAYFSPPFWMMRRIGKLARLRGARLVMAGKSDNGATIRASRALYKYLLKRDTEIWEFTACKLHEKLIVIDDVTYIGSANCDMRSLYLNLELMLRIEDAELATRMREHIGHQLQGSQAITPAIHKRRANPIARIRWWFAWFVVSVVDYTVTRRLDLGE
ncbi:MAG: phospholipase D-like domain-containing protein [Tsuneonella suprasediminis]|nr:phosphatidylserine/phosphatidylglycerophosphate/cardiolipin synthase family protein [Altererythrobacter sp. N1]